MALRDKELLFLKSTTPAAERDEGWLSCWMGDERLLVVTTCSEEKCEWKGYCYDKDIINTTYLNSNR